MKFHHFGLEVSNLNDARTFYVNVLGFREESFLELNGERLLFLKKDDLRIELIEADFESGDQKNQTHLCFETECLHSIMDKGFTIVEGPIVWDNGWTSLFAHGSEGELIEFLCR